MVPAWSVQHSAGAGPGLSDGFMSCFEPVLLMNIHLVNVCICGRTWSDACLHQHQSKVTEEQLTLTHSNFFGSFQINLERSNWLWSAPNKGTAPHFSYRKGRQVIAFGKNASPQEDKLFVVPLCLLSIWVGGEASKPHSTGLDPFDKPWMASTSALSRGVLMPSVPTLNLGQNSGMKGNNIY